MWNLLNYRALLVHSCLHSPPRCLLQGSYSMNIWPLINDEYISYSLLSWVSLSVMLFEGDIFSLDCKLLKRRDCVYLFTAMAPGPAPVCGIQAVFSGDIFFTSSWTPHSHMTNPTDPSSHTIWKGWGEGSPCRPIYGYRLSGF